MNFKDMNEKQQDAFKNLLLTVLNIKSQEEQRYIQEYHRLLLIGNGSGVVLVVTFMNSIVKNTGQILSLRTPLILFLIGTFLASLVYVILASVANVATNYITAQVIEFFLDKRSINDVTGYNLNRVGHVLMNLLLFSSLILFGTGIYKCISFLGKLA